MQEQECNRPHSSIFHQMSQGGAAVAGKGASDAGPVTSVTCVEMTDEQIKPLDCGLKVTTTVHVCPVMCHTFPIVFPLLYGVTFVCCDGVLPLLYIVTFSGCNGVLMDLSMFLYWEV